jgi:hypothetical protein
MYYELARKEFATFFPELVEFDIASRAQHKKFRDAVMVEALDGLPQIKNADGSSFVPQVRTDTGGVLAGRQFCEYSEYHNNASFRQFLDETYSSLLERGLFSGRFLTDVRQRFLAGRKAASDQMKGLLSLELNVRAGTIEV